MQGKYLRMVHKSFLRNLGLKPREFLFLNKDYESYTFLHRRTNRKVTIRR